MNKYFVDTDVIIDLLAARQPHFHFAAVLFTLGEMGKFKLYTTPTVMVNTFYSLRKQLGNEGAKTALRKLRLIIQTPEMFLVGNGLAIQVSSSLW